jgi:DNA-binding XRE family transcriptional regulator
VARHCRRRAARDSEIAGTPNCSAADNLTAACACPFLVENLANRVPKDLRAVCDKSKSERLHSAIIQAKGLNVAQREAQLRTEMPPGEPTHVISAGGTRLSFYESEFLIRLGDRLRTMRGLRDMSRRELASQSGVSERYIAQIEAGKGNVSIVLLLRIAKRCAGNRRRP